MTLTFDTLESELRAHFHLEVVAGKGGALFRAGLQIRTRTRTPESIELSFTRPLPREEKTLLDDLPKWRPKLLNHHKESTYEDPPPDQSNMKRPAGCSKGCAMDAWNKRQ